MIKLLQIDHMGLDGNKLNDKEFKSRALRDLMLTYYCHGKDFDPFSRATFVFKQYRFEDYPYQDELKEHVKNVYTNSDGELYWAGDKYNSLDQLYDELSTQKCISVLTICDIINLNCGSN